MTFEKMFLALNIGSSGMSAQRRRMNAIANNITNAETTKTENGGPYKRKLISFKENKQSGFASSIRSASIRLSQTSDAHFASGPFRFGSDKAGATSIESKEAIDPAEGKVVYDPGHPDADQNGYVRLSNVNVVTEMIDMMIASRAFEANVTAVNATKQMAKDSLEI